MNKTETITISKKEYQAMKKKLSENKKIKNLSVLLNSSFSKDWNSKEDDIWDTY